MTRGEDTQAGFTLIEVLIALFIFALISAGTMTALNGTLRAKTQMDERLSSITEIENARALMASDFANVRLLPTRDVLGGISPYVFSGGVDNLVTFTRAGRVNPGGLETRSEFQRVSYVFENGKLIRRALRQANPAPRAETVDRVLLDGLTSADVEFFLRRQQTTNISGETLNVSLHNFSQEHVLVQNAQQAELPEIISFRFEFENGDTLTQLFELPL